MEKKKGIIIALLLAMVMIGCGTDETPEDEPTEVHLNCIRSNNTPCVVDGTCPANEQIVMNINDTEDLLDGDLLWYNNSWCDVEWR